MAQSKFGLNFAGVQLPIFLSKATDPEPFHFNRGYNGKPVKNINVAPTSLSGGTVTTKDDIQEVVPFANLQQLYLVDKGTAEERYIVVDSKEIKRRLFPKSDTMFTYCVTEIASLSFDQFDGDHYFVLLQKSKGQKDYPQELKIIYTIFHKYLSANKRGIVVSYISNNKEKFGLIYPVGNLLKLSVLHYSNFQRTSPVDLLEIISPEIAKSLNGLFESLCKKVPASVYRDTSGPKIEKAIQDIIDGKETVVTDEPVVQSNGLLAQLMAAASSKTPSVVQKSLPPVPEKTK